MKLAIWNERMKLTFISDTHNIHDQVPLDRGDVIIHCGDLTKRGNLEDVRSFATFMEKQNFTHKIVIAGNHDFCFEDERREEAEQIFKASGICYLNDSALSIEGLKFWGSPIQPWYHDWAFNRQPGVEIRKHWDLIPEDTDVLITHGPPYGIADLCDRGVRVGCSDLLEMVKKIKPRIHAFGHIHEGYGIVDLDGIKFINACSLDLHYKYNNPPIIVDI